MKKLVLPIIAALLLTAMVSTFLLDEKPPSQVSTNGNSQDNNLLEPDIHTEVIAEGLNQPWDIAVTPNNTILFSEKAGTISLLTNGAKQVIHQIEDVHAVGEGGLLGLAIDNDFAINRYIYACYNTSSDIRVTRWQLAADNMSVTKEEPIVTGIPANTTTFQGRHSGCRPRFGPDGNVWIATGDAAQSTNPQNPQSLGGKILRVDRNGKPIGGNLGAPFDPRIYSYGHRNVQGLAFDFNQSTEDAVVGYAIEHGTNKDDEINKLQTGNFGWEPGPGYDESAPMTDTNAFPGAIEALWSSGSSTIAPSGGAVIHGEQWGKYQGHLAVAVLKDRHIRVFDPANNMQFTEWLTGDYGRIRTVVQSADGSLYASTDNGNNQDVIIRITPKN